MSCNVRPVAWPAVRYPRRSADTARPSGTSTKKLSLKKTPASARSSAAARRRLARAATAARALREAQEPRFKLDDSGALVPDVRAEAAIIYDSATGHVLWESNSQNQRSIASITKVMTAAVFVEIRRTSPTRWSSIVPMFGPRRPRICGLATR